jgi:hypothetical protein
MMSYEEFRPANYKTFQQLPETQKRFFKEVEGGFVKKTALDLDKTLNWLELAGTHPDLIGATTPENSSIKIGVSTRYAHEYPAHGLDPKDIVAENISLGLVVEAIEFIAANGLRARDLIFCGYDRAYPKEEYNADYFQGENSNPTFVGYNTSALDVVQLFDLGQDGTKIKAQHGLPLFFTRDVLAGLNYANTDPGDTLMPTLGIYDYRALLEAGMDASKLTLNTTAGFAEQFKVAEFRIRTDHTP